MIPTLIDSHKAATVLVAPDSDKPGSGVRVGSDTILTCRHCVAGAKKGDSVKVMLFRPGTISSDWVERLTKVEWLSDPGRDIAVLSLPSSQFPTPYVMPLQDCPEGAMLNCTLYGYPAAAAGMLEKFTAELTDPRGQCALAKLSDNTFLNVGTISLREAKQRLDGMSGGPVVLKDGAAYLLNMQLLTESEYEGATPTLDRLYSVPVSLFLACPKAKKHIQSALSASSSKTSSEGDSQDHSKEAKHEFVADIAADAESIFGNHAKRNALRATLTLACIGYAIDALARHQIPNWTDLAVLLATCTLIPVAYIAGRTNKNLRSIKARERAT